MASTLSTCRVTTVSSALVSISRDNSALLPVQLFLALPQLRHRRLEDASIRADWSVVRLSSLELGVSPPRKPNDCAATGGATR